MNVFEFLDLSSQKTFNKIINSKNFFHTNIYFNIA